MTQKQSPRFRHSGIILIVDDEPLSRKTIEALLLSQNYHLVAVSNGQEALEMANVFLPDLILLDVMMPGMDGFEVCRRLRANARLAEVPIIMVTALDDRESRLQGIESGADDFIIKPFDRVELRARIKTIMRLNRYRRLVEEREKFERIITLSPDGIAIVDQHKNLQLANRAMLRMIGAAEDASIEGQPITQYIAPDQHERCMSRLEGVIANLVHVERLETFLTAINGDALPVEIQIGVCVWEAMPAAQIIIRDITERKNYEARLQRQIQRLGALRTVDRTITASLDLNITLRVLLDQAMSQLDVHAARVLTLNAQTHIIECLTERGFRSMAIGRTQGRLGQGLAGRSALHRQPLLVDDLRAVEDSSVQLIAKNEGFTVYYVEPLIARGRVKGLLELYNRSPFNSDPEWLAFVETLASQAAIAIDNYELFQHLQQSKDELDIAYDATLESWVRALDERNQESDGYTRRVIELTLRLARAYGIPDEDLIHIRRGALLHDIGKMAIPDHILLKPGPLTQNERKIISLHPANAYEWLSSITSLRPALEIPYCHQERWDGTGYPRGLKGEGIPLAARLFSVVDVWISLCSDRPYRTAWTEEQARMYIKEQAGKLFDPRVVEVFLPLTE